MTACFGWKWIEANNDKTSFKSRIFLCCCVYSVHAKLLECCSVSRRYLQGRLHKRTHTHTSTHTYTWTYTHAHTHTRAHPHVHTCTHHMCFLQQDIKRHKFAKMMGCHHKCCLYVLNTVANTCCCRLCVMLFDYRNIPSTFALRKCWKTKEQHMLDWNIQLVASWTTNYLKLCSFWLTKWQCCNDTIKSNSANWMSNLL